MSMVTVGVWVSQLMADKGSASCATAGAVVQVNTNRTAVSLLDIQRYRLANLCLWSRKIRTKNWPQIREAHKANGQEYNKEKQCSDELAHMLPQFLPVVFYFITGLFVNITSFNAKWRILAGKSARRPEYLGSWI